MMAGVLSSLIIEELTGKKRSLELRGPGLPHRGANWPSKLQVSTNWYPGNEEATQQVLGPREGQSHWEGSWRRTQLARSPCIAQVSGQSFRLVNPHELWDVFEALMRGGSRLQAAWMTVTPDGDPVTRIRQGRMVEFEPKVDRVTDVMWSATWDWASRGTSTQKVAATRAGGAAAAQDALASQLTDFSDSLAASPLVTTTPGLPKLPSSFTLGQLEALANGPLALVNSFNRKLLQITNDLNRVGQLAATLKGEPFAIADAVVSAAHNVVSTANQFGDEISGEPPEMQTQKQDVASLVRAATTFGAAVDSQRRLSRSAQQVADQNTLVNSSGAGGPGASTRHTSALAPGNLLAVHVCRAGDTPQRLSLRYYKTPDLAVEILRANAMPWNTIELPVGRTVIVPVLSGRQRVA